MRGMDLVLWEECDREASLRAARYQQALRRYDCRSVRSRTLEVGNLVLRQMLSGEGTGKWRAAQNFGVVRFPPQSAARKAQYFPLLPKRPADIEPSSTVAPPCSPHTVRSCSPPSRSTTHGLCRSLLSYTAASPCRQRDREQGDRDRGGKATSVGAAQQEPVMAGWLGRQRRHLHDLDEVRPQLHLCTGHDTMMPQLPRSIYFPGDRKLRSGCQNICKYNFRTSWDVKLTYNAEGEDQGNQ
ncbi:uncharacterized protein LOC125518697 [Triticum urartu]|uniref:uncharacterized protein LOC125518697 n=1 Tax=Triticum urartu TaxID=4572 RepID=UPI00204432CC|nr:uncharacterized protein LOC125518697 [Triticum urartu]